MDESTEHKQDSHRHISKARVIGKLFGKDKKPASNDDDVSDFLHGPSDKLYMTGAAPPKLPKLDISKASRWPTAAEVNRLRETSRGRSVSLKRGGKGLNVRFTDTKPEIIGEGGDEAELPTLQISERKRSNSHPPILQRPLATQTATNEVEHANNKLLKDSRHVPALWMQTELGTRPDAPWRPGSNGSQHDERSKSEQPAGFIEAHSANSLAARVQADMRRAEGEAFRRASKVFEEPQHEPSTDLPSQIDGFGSSLLPLPHRPPSQLPVPPLLVPGGNRPGSSGGRSSMDNHQPPTAFAPAAPVPTDQADVLETFLDRVQHLFKLFQLSAESVIPLGMCSFEALIRAASWWFLKGKNNLENTVRARPSSSDGQQSYSMSQQQAHADIAKSLWILKSVIADRPEYKLLRAEDAPNKDGIPTADVGGNLADMLTMCQTITHNLRELAAFMRRQNMLPPPVEEALLPQGLDNAIWISYPPLPPDAFALLSSGRMHSISASVNNSMAKLSSAILLADTGEVFVYARIFVDIFLSKDGVDSPQDRIPCIMFVTRAQTETDLKIILTSQNDLVWFCITSDRAQGPTWNDVQWRSKISAMDVQLPKGFLARVQCFPHDFKIVWNMYDYTIKVHSSLSPRRDEKNVFEETVKVFQYFDRDRQSRLFPKEPIAGCLVRIFEKRIIEPGGIGARIKYCGFRLAVITGTKTKSLSGINHDLLTNSPLQYGFMRGEGDAPALLLKFDDGPKKPTMVFTFIDISARSRLHSCLNGGATKDEVVLAHIPLENFSISTLSTPNSYQTLTALGNLEWQGIWVINQAPQKNPELGHANTILSDSLRVVMNSKSVSLTDRIGFHQGELQFHLSTQPSTNTITLKRQAQDDITILLSESQISKDMPQEVKTFLELIAKSQSLRKYAFPKIEDVHQFQTAITGFHVLFDGLAQSLAISRRRSVVSLSKKWEASPARVQILQRDKVVQVAAFFDDFGYGECMNFVLKVTDIFESFARSGKFCMRIVDAKFAMPKSKEGKYEGICLDIPEYAGEHDDITISFDSELDRDQLTRTLPAPVKIVSRLGTIKR